MLNPLRIFSSTIVGLKRASNILTKSFFEEPINRGISRPLQRFGHRLPLIGKLFVKTGEIGSFLASIPRRIVGKLTNWTERFDETVKAHQ